jgi:PIN domain nuclease of toxin-antitoxin system
VKYLLDTHTLLWTLFDSPQLPDWQRAILGDGISDLYVSDISLWEISLKYSLGKLELDGIEPDQLPDVIEDLGAELRPISSESICSYHRLPAKENHRDPFDRMLIWQAISGRLTMLSSDRYFPQYQSDGLLLATPPTRTL